MYVNPVPAIDVGKKFELRLVLDFPDPIPVEEAKKHAAEWLAAQPPEEIAKWLSCARTWPMYPRDLSREEMEKLGVAPDDPRLSFARDAGSGKEGIA